jgi:ribosomal protein L17
MERTPDGKFGEGNKAAVGHLNAYARQVARLRQAVLSSVTEDDLRQIVQAMVAKAKEGDMMAAREVLTRIIGKPPESPDPDSLDNAERRLLDEKFIFTLRSDGNGKP